MRLGFTGTREGMSQEQYDRVEIFVIENANNIVEAHHGDCIGADAEFDALIRLHFDDPDPRHIHPPLKGKYRAWCQEAGAKMYPPKDYYARNRDIVLASDWLIATPLSPERVGGTWYTINWGLEQREMGLKPNLRVMLITREGEEMMMPNARDIG